MSGIKHIIANTQLVVGTNTGIEAIETPSPATAGMRETLNDGLIRMTAGQRWPTLEKWREELRRRGQA